MTNQRLAANYLPKMKRIWIIRYEEEQKTIALNIASLAADGGEEKPKNIFNSQKNAELRLPFKKRLGSYRYEDFQPVNEKENGPEAAAGAEKRNSPRNSRSDSSDSDKPRFVPGPYEKPVTRRQTKKPAIEQTKKPMPSPKVRTNGKRKSKSGKENQQIANNNQTNIANNCEPSTSEVENNLPIETIACEPKEQQQQQELLPQQQQDKELQQQKSNESNNTGTESEGDDLIALLKMVTEQETSELKAFVKMVNSDDGPIDYSIKHKEEPKIIIQKSNSPGTSNVRKRKPKSTQIESLKIRLVSKSIQGIMHNKPLVL